MSVYCVICMIAAQLFDSVGTRPFPIRSEKTDPHTTVVEHVDISACSIVVFICIIQKSIAIA